MNEPTLSDQRKSPSGVLPKNIQAWAMVGVALLIVAVVALSGGAKKAPATAQAGPGVSGAAASALDETTRQIQELKAAQERLQQEAILAQQIAQAPTPPEQPPDANAASPAPGDDLAAAARKRDYTSLFASQVAASYRAAAAGRRNPPARVEGLESAAAQPAEETGPAEGGTSDTTLGASRNTAPGPEPAAASTPPSQQAITSRHHDTSNRVRPGAREFTLFEGTVLESALLTRLNSDASGPVIATTTAPLYSRNRQKVLVPAGSRVLGEAKKVETTGQTRLAVSFHRLIMPDGYAIDLDRFVGLSGLGETALKDQVNNHYVQMFGASIALGLLGGLSAFGTQNPTLAEPQPILDTYRQGVAASFGQVAGRVLDRFTNILPTLTIREGHRLRVYLTQDLRLPAYDDHAMPKDL